MKHKFLLKSLSLALSVVIATSSTTAPALADTTTIQISSEGTAAINGIIYATVNMPYADFYYGELNNISAGTTTTPALTTDDPVAKAGYREEGYYDAVSSATTSKSKSYATTYYEETSTGVNIIGIKDVQIAIPEELYNNAKKAEANNEKCNNQLYTFIDSLTTSSEPFTEYKVLNADGTFSKMVSETTIASGTTATITNLSAWGNYQIDIEGIDVHKDTMLGAVIEAKDSNGTISYYGMRHLDNLWLQTAEMSFAVQKFLEPHGNYVDYKAHQSLEGQIITKITYLVKNGADVVIPVNLPVKYLLNNDTTITASNIPAANSPLTTTFQKSGFPDGYDFTLSTLSYGGVNLDSSTYNFDSKTPILTLKDSNTWKPGKYIVTFSDDVYGDISTNFLVVSKLQAKDIAITNNTLTITGNDTSLSEYISAITNVKINGTTVKGRNLGTILFNEDGSVKFDASANFQGTVTPYFANGIDVDYTLSIEAAGYPSIEAKIGKSYIKPTAVTVVLNATSYPYNGKIQKPTITVTDSQRNTISAKHYTVTYPNASKSPGYYKVKITFDSKYTGTETYYYTIKPNKTTVTLKDSTKDSLKASWIKITGISGYEIQYSTSSSFTKATTVTASASTTTKKITTLKKNATYYVRIRSYRTVTIDGKSSKIYSSWSTVKKVKTTK